MLKYLFIVLVLLNLTANAAPQYQPTEEYAKQLDAQDPLKHMRGEYLIPTHNGQETVYLNGNSLGLQHAKVSQQVNRELTDWAALGVEGHFKESDPWYTYHEQFRGPISRIIGAKEHEVVFMNTLTLNLHLMMVSFYQPTKTKYKILMEGPVFASDTYAVKSQLEFHGHDPETALVIVEPRPGQKGIYPEDVKKAMEQHDGEIALVMLNAVNFLTGQFIKVPEMAKIAHDHGALFGVDLAHAAGNVPLELHDWGVDFAAWCSYKYLSGGPGAIGGAFVHEKHAKNPKLKRFAGWWGNDPKKRFNIQLERNFVPVQSADAWQISNPPIFSMVPLKASLEAYDKVGMKAFREKSLKLTGYLEYLLSEIKADDLEIATPKNPEERGCQLSLVIKKDPTNFSAWLKKHNITCDFRKPNVVRVAPTPMYNTYQDVWKFAQATKAYFART